MPAADNAQRRAMQIFGRAVWAVADQAFFALANLAVQIVLSQRLSADEFGGFAVSLAFFQLVFALQHAALLEPMMVYGNAGGMLDRKRYLAQVVLCWNGALGLLSTAALALCGFAAWLSWGGQIGVSLVALAFVAPPTMLFWALRRLCYLEGRPQIAAAGSFVYLFTVSTALFAIDVFWSIGVISGCGVMGVAALAGSAALSPVAAGMRPVGTAGGNDGMLQRHVRYGRWSVPSEIMNWLTGSLPMLLLPFVGTLSETASVKLMHLVMMPFYQGLTALSMLALPMLAAALQNARGAGLGVTFLVASFGGCGLVYGAALLVVAAPLDDLLFGEKYEFEPFWLYAAAAHCLALGLAQAFFVACRAADRPKGVTLSYVAIVAALLSIPPMHATAGVAGVLMAQAFAWSAGAIVAWSQLRKLPRRSTHEI